MKVFMNPELDVVKFDAADIITASQTGGNGPWTPEDEF